MEKKEFKNMKFRVDSEEESKKLQEYLFSLDYEWICGKEISYLNKCFIYTNEGGLIWYGIYKTNFIDHSCKEYKLKEIVSYELEEVIPERKIVKIGENSYIESELIEFLQKAKEIKPI